MFNNNDNTLNNKTAYQATASSLENIKNIFPEYKSILLDFNEGVKKVELRKRFMLKKLDEVWVRAIEDTLPSIDVIIRNPSVFLQEKEEVLPVELTRKITGRSVEYLCQHTDMINEIKDDGMVIPSKILNVFQEDTILTYENKFINTLLQRVYAFVSLRYDSAKECGEDEKNTALTFNQEFEKGERRGKISLSIEVSEPPKDNEKVKNYIYTSDLWKRLVAVKKILDSYMGSNFVAQMGRNFVRPPIMRTNKLLKNVDFRQCLSLWEFLDSYENTGYETLIDEKLENISDDCIKDFYNTLVAQYILFKKHITNDFEDQNTLDSRTQEIHPLIKEELDDFNEREYDYRDLVKNGKPQSITSTGEEDSIEQAIYVALKADELMFVDEEPSKFSYRYRYSFMAHLILSQNPAQDYYTEIKNKLLSYNGIKSKISWKYDSFNLGRNKCAKIKVKGKTVYLYLPLNCNDFKDSKYHLKDVSDKKQFEDLPSLLKVKSSRGVKYAKELITLIMNKFGIYGIENYVRKDYHLPLRTIEELLKQRLVKYADGSYYTPIIEEGRFNLETETAKTGFDYRYRYSFMAHLILAQDSTKEYYSQVKNELLSYNGVKSKISWKYDSFNLGRNKCTKIKVKGKTVYLYLPLNCNDFNDTKYHLKDVSDKKQYKELPSLLKVKSVRGVKYAKELIYSIMQGYNTGVLTDYRAKNYRLPRKTLDELLKQRLVKYADGSFYQLSPEEQQVQEEIASTRLTISSKYRYSFMARLITATDEIKEKYNSLKNYALSFDNVKDKISWGHEAFRVKKNVLFKFKLRGKHIYIYFALYNDKLDPRYHTKNLIKEDKQVILPTLIKVRSSRSEKYAKELIDLVMHENNIIKMDNYREIDFKTPKKTVKQLINSGLIKVNKL